MSYILDALNKSEQERIRKSNTPTAPQTPEVRQREKSSTWMYLYPGVVTMVFVAAATGYYLAKSTADTPPENTRPQPLADAAPAAPAAGASRPPATRPAAVKPTAATRAAPAADTGTPPARHPGAASATSALKEKAAAATQSPLPVPEEPPRQPTQEALQTQAAAVAAEEAESEVPETFLKMFAENAAAARATAETRPQPEAEVTERPKVYKPRPPHISELDLSIRNALPDIEYSAHVYSDNGGSGFVILNGSMRYNGYRVAQDLYVRDILEDGVVLEYRGTKFRLPAMKSWHKYE